MPTSLVTRIDLDAIYPDFLERFLNLIADVRTAGKDFYAVSGYRSLDEQEAKYAIGRSKPGARITNARGGFSLHNYGLAIDCALDKDHAKAGLQPDWDNGKGQYTDLRAPCGKYKLQVGVPSVPGGDPGHVQVPCVSVLGMQEMTALVTMRGIYLRRKEIKDVWDWVAKHASWT
jgi:hypothetical protein